MRFRLGEFDPLENSPYGSISPDVINSEAHHQVALEAARKSMVLLKNENQLLPLDRDSVRKVAVIGPFSDRVITQGYNGRHDEVVTALKGIRDYLGDGVEVVYAQGAEAALVARTQTDREAGMSGGASLKLDAGSVGEYIEFQITVPEAGAYALELQYKGYPSRGVYQTSVNGSNTGNLVDMYHRDADYGLMADLGKVELNQGTNSIRFEVVGQNSDSNGYSGHFDKLKLTGAATLEFELEQADHKAGTKATSQADQALEAAQGADAVILCLGSDTRNEREGLDRTFLGLPGNQQALADLVLETYPQAIVVLFAAGPLVVPEIKEQSSAILQAWWPGQRGGTAIAETLFGAVNPGGHLPYTVYASEAQVPSIDEYEINEGFTYMYLKGKPLFAFGHGLSYTTFGYDHLRLSTAGLGQGGTITAQIDVTNTGERAGDDVVQLYVKAMGSNVFRPTHELRGYQRVSLKPGETQTVSIAVQVDRLSYFDVASKNFVVEAGEYEIQIGAASDDIRATKRIRIPEQFVAQLEAPR